MFDLGLAHQLLGYLIIAQYLVYNTYTMKNVANVSEDADERMDVE